MPRFCISEHNSPQTITDIRPVGPLKRRISNVRRIDKPPLAGADHLNDQPIAPLPDHHARYNRIPRQLLASHGALQAPTASWEID